MKTLVLTTEILQETRRNTVILVASRILFKVLKESKETHHDCFSYEESAMSPGKPKEGISLPLKSF